MAKEDKAQVAHDSSLVRLIIVPLENPLKVPTWQELDSSSSYGNVEQVENHQKSRSHLEDNRDSSYAPGAPFLFAPKVEVHGIDTLQSPWLVFFLSTFSKHPKQQPALRSVLALSPSVQWCSCELFTRALRAR